MALVWKRRERISLYCNVQESSAVLIAAGNLAEDLGRVLNAHVVRNAENAGSVRAESSAGLSGKEARRWDIVICTLEYVEAAPAGLADTLRELASKLPMDPLEAQERNRVRKEAYVRAVREDALYIVGADRRGTIYGIYDFCREIGVSPWYFWGDVPVREREEISLSERYFVEDYPSVEYRGVFINDEEELEKWVRLHMDEDTIGVKTYEKIFELLLRLKGNYIWPAMHVNSFNLKKENGALAERMGIVVGTSHCDMLMRSNNREWKPWIEKKGYQDAVYDFSVEGKNREILKEYWRESVEQNRDFEVSYTLGMRGIHDSGFETQKLNGLEGEELLRAKIELLNTVISAQQEILRDTLGEERERLAMKTFVPYKEVLELYDNGLEIPEELTLVWANDNYGHIRRFPGEREKKRKGGNGIYYHNSYWAPPGGSYLFLASIPLAHTRNELYKAWQEGIRKLWVMNIGALKPLEQEIAYYLQLAWEVGKKEQLTEDVDGWVENWINEAFSGNHGKEMACVLNDFSQLTNVRKVEQMDTDVFSQTSYGDEASERIRRYERLAARAEAVYASLPERERDAFFELCLMKIHAAYSTNCMYYYADRSALCVRQGKYAAAAEYVRRCREYDDARRRLLDYYGKEMAGGKWEGIVTPEDFPPPRTAMYPACVPPLKKGIREMLVDCWNEEKGISFVAGGAEVKWIQLSNPGEGVLSFSIKGPDWLGLSETNGVFGFEKRILVWVKETLAAGKRQEGFLNIACRETGQMVSVPVSAMGMRAKAGAADRADHTAGRCKAEKTDDGGVIVLETADFYQLPQEADCGKKPLGWKRIPRLGRGEGDLLEAWDAGARIRCTFRLGDGKGTDRAGNTAAMGSDSDNCGPLLEVHRFPSLDSTGRIRVCVEVDQNGGMLLESDATDEWRGGWKRNIRDNVDRLYLRLPCLEEGSHTLTLTAVDRYFAFSRMAVYIGERKESMGTFLRGNPELPGYMAPEERFFYGKRFLAPRKMLVAPIAPPWDSLIDVDVELEQMGYAGGIQEPEDILEKGKSCFAEENGRIYIDAAAALAQTAYAYADGGAWDYCSSESYGRKGLAMHIRRPGLEFKEAGKIPALHYRIRCHGGKYRIWILMKCNSLEDSHMTLGVDGIMHSEQELYGGHRIWRYCAEQAYRYVPVWETILSAGEHTLELYSLVSGIRFDRIYMTTGEELPPADEAWRG